MRGRMRTAREIIEADGGLPALGAAARAGIVAHAM